jgi:hypothetical protein
MDSPDMMIGKLVYTCTEEQEADMLESFLGGNKSYPAQYPASAIFQNSAGMTNWELNIYVRESQWKKL